MPEITPPTPRLRPARLEDLDVVLPWAPDAEAMRLWAGPTIGFPVTREQFWENLWAGPTIGFPVTREQFWENLRKVPGAAFVLCAAPSGEIVAFGQVMHREDGYAHLARIIVSPAHRGEGLGRVLCRELMKVAPTFLPVRAFSLYVYPENNRAHALYRSLGFVDARAERGFLRMEKCGLEIR